MDIEEKLQAKLVYEQFEKLFDKQLVQQIVRCTQLQLNVQQDDLKQFDEFEFWQFIKVIFVIILSPRNSLEDYWSTEKIYACDYIKQIMTLKKYKYISDIICCYDKSDQDQTQSTEDEFLQNLNDENWIQRKISHNLQDIEIQILAHAIMTSKEINNILNDMWECQEFINYQEPSFQIPYFQYPPKVSMFDKYTKQTKAAQRHYIKQSKQHRKIKEKQQFPITNIHILKNINQKQTQQGHINQLLSSIKYQNRINNKVFKYFVYCLQICIVNSYIIYNIRKQSKSVTTIRQYTYLLFKAIEIKTMLPTEEEVFEEENLQLVANHEQINVKDNVLIKNKSRQSCCICIKVKTYLTCSCGMVLCKQCYIKHLRKLKIE
ncbi:PiggyBac_transposable element-derived protein [Hexamita inflata]|uniref:PiggyBac transposable element-derived protein n=1 Tax=Hexamita inflata TaxID=28002 RepID=A0AA86P1H6_9EUKA|nr:PiggyBac transposable element-derived protein [Hexamita inflata]